MKYIINILASLSVILNTVTGGSYRNTFSARVGYQSNIKNKFWAKTCETVINTILFFDKNHCYKEYIIEKDTFR